MSRNSIPIINLLSQSPLLAADNFPIYSNANGDARRVSATTLLAFVQAGIVIPSAPITQYASPSATAFSVTIAPIIAGQNVRLLLTPTGTLATGTIVLPGAGGSALPVDRQEVIVTSTQTVTTLTVSAGTTTVTGAPATLVANTPFKMFYDAVNAAWYRTP